MGYKSIETPRYLKPSSSHPPNLDPSRCRPPKFRPLPTLSLGQFRTLPIQTPEQFTPL